MDEYYFTFGMNHLTKTGQPLGTFFVVILAESENRARNIMWEARGAKWAFSYPKEQFGNQADKFSLSELTLQEVRLYENKEERPYNE